jgi:hypothetical protein
LRFATAPWLMMLTGPLSAQPLPGGLTHEPMKAIRLNVLKYLPADVWTTIPLSTPEPDRFRLKPSGSGSVCLAGDTIALKAIPHDLFAKIPLDLLAKVPPNAATMTPDQARAYYQSLDPAQKKSLKEQVKQIKAQIDGVPGLMDKLKALLRSLLGS